MRLNPESYAYAVLVFGISFAFYSFIAADRVIEEGGEHAVYIFCRPLLLADTKIAAGRRSCPLLIKGVDVRGPLKPLPHIKSRTFSAGPGRD